MRRFDLVAFDVDGTLVQHPDGMTVWEVLNERFAPDEVLHRGRLRAYMDGRLTYPEWVALDVCGWRDAGARREDLVSAFAPLRLVDGAAETLRALAEAGIRLAIVSGTLDLLLDTLLPGHPFDEVHANHIGFDGSGAITHWRATPFDMEGKAEGLRSIALRMGIPLARCAFVGDSDNDVWIARVAGFTVAFHPKCKELEKIAHAVVRTGDLRSILPYLLDGIAPACSASRQET